MNENQISQYRSNKINNQKSNKLQLIPKAEDYIQYEIEMIYKLPRTEKFGIGNELKLSMYQMLENIMFLNRTNSKLEDENKVSLKLLNKIDVALNVQRIYLRIMYKNRWIDKKKFDVSMDKVYEIGKILGGLIKYYAKENKK